MFPAYSVEAQAPEVYGYALILLVIVPLQSSKLNNQSFLAPYGPGAVRCCPLRSNAVNSHTLICVYFTTYYGQAMLDRQL